MAIKIYFAGQEIPPNENYAYIVAKDGHFILKKNDIFESCTKIDEIPELAKQDETFVLKAKKIPYKLIKQVLAFFFAVYQKHKTEAMVLLCYEQNNWSVYVPEQEVSTASVKYKSDKHNVVGSIHSHPAFSCRASGVDDRDEANFDGLHIIISTFEDVCPEIACYVVINGRRFEIERETVIDGLPQPCQMIPEEWLKQVSPLREFLFEKGGELVVTKEEPQQKKEPDKLEENLAEEWPCEKCLHEDVCYQDVMEADGTCQFYEFDPRRIGYQQQNKQPKNCGEVVV